MNQRDIFLKEFRGEIIGTLTENSSSDEVFQNKVLRPILKLQNELFISFFANYLIKNKVNFGSYSIDKKISSIENAIQKDIKLRNTLKGVVIGLFSSDEYQIYNQNSSSINKRMMAMISEGLKSQIQLF